MNSTGRWQNTASTEKLAFIINCDIKCRISKDAAEADDESPTS